MSDADNEAAFDRDCEVERIVSELHSLLQGNTGFHTSPGDVEDFPRRRPSRYAGRRHPRPAVRDQGRGRRHEWCFREDGSRRAQTRIFETDQQPHRILDVPSSRSGKSALIETAVMAMVRAGKTVTIVRPDGSTQILPFKRPVAR